MSNIISTANGDIELTDREMTLYKNLVRFSAAYNVNSGARRVWNVLVSEYGTAVVDYLKDIAAVAGPCNAAWGTEGHRARLEQVDAVIHSAMADLRLWAKPLC